ncbi:uncharacterized protein [Salvelinus sp. IW2-2015]|uniref:uncharacterized protein n=1 Tax=Salvelinus sp. IW2-2015 TaxID=2691554 RepID=UPI000CDF8EA9|nr:uncharacterized protein LOC111978875 [Salvelinus alpinus]XP_023864882.1 uncharacterized protein LOC111978875 [Salvelinus alpinus]
MYSDSTRMGHYRFIHQNTDDYCYCLHCVQYGPTLYQGGPGGYRPPPTHPDHPELDLRGDISLPPFPVEPEDIEPGLEKCERGGEGRGDGGGGEGGEGEGSGAKAGAGWGVSGHSAPQRRPVFTGPGQYGQPQPGQFSPSHPWNYNPAQWTCPVEPGLGLRFYSPVKEQCGYVGQGGGGAAGTGTGTHPFNSSRNASASSLDLAHTQFRGQRTKHRQASYSYGPEKQIWDQSKYRLERQASYSPQEQHRQASLGLEKQVWGQSNHRLERQNSFSPQEIHRQASYIYSPEDKLTHRQTSYGPEQQVWGQLKHRQTSYSYSPEEQVWGCPGDEHDHLDRCVPLEQGDLHPHMPNGHSGGGGPSPRHVYSQGVGYRTNYQERTTRLKAGGAVGGAGVDSCNGRHVPAGSGSVQKTFFSTEVPQKQLVSQPRQRSHCGPGLGHRTPSHGATGPVHGATIGREERFNQRAKQAASQGVNQNQGRDPDSDPQRQRGKQKEGQGSVRENQRWVWENQCHVRENKGSVQQKEGSVREQIRQVVSDLEGVLGGLKQVHVEMKEVVEQIDLLTANIDLEEEEGSCNSSPHGGDALPNPRDCRGVLMYNQKNSTGEQMYTHKIRTVDLKTNGDQGLLYRDPDHTVTIQTTSPSHVLTASVIKTNRIGVTALSPLIPSPSEDSKQERRGLNKDPTIPGPSRDINHVTQTPGLEQIPSLPLRTHTLIPTAMVGYSVPSRRSQKPPLYPHPNRRLERLNKGLAPPPYPAQSALPVLPHLAQPPYPAHPNHPALPPSALKTPPYLEKSRPSSSMV